MSSYADAYAGAFAGASLPLVETGLGKGLAVTFAVLLFLSFVKITLRYGLGTALWEFVVVVTIAITIFLAWPGGDFTRLVSLYFAFILAAEVAGMVVGAIVVAIARILANKWTIVALIPIILIAAWVGMKSGVEGTTDPSELLLARLVAVASLPIFWSFSVYVGWQAMVGNKRYTPIRRIAIALCSWGGTSFRAANLTDADFTQASLKTTDFRQATLTRTCWLQAKHLDQARTEGTYLEYPQIRQLATTKQGQGQSFDHLDLRELNLEAANLADASLVGTRLSEATLQYANLTRATLVQAQLYGTNLTGACLTGAIIENWGISTDTRFDGVQCEYIYMHQPTKIDPDPCRKPDNRHEVFQEGDFTDFITPIIKTLDLYQSQHIDPRLVARTFKTLDLYHYEGIDPSAAAIALKQLAEQYPEAGLQVVALEGRGDEKIRLQATVAGMADRSQLSEAYFTKYQELAALPKPDLQTLLMGIAEKDQRIRSLEQMVMTAIASQKFYVETYYSLGDTMSESSSININSGGGNVSGIVGGSFNNVSGVVNLGTISGDVRTAIGRLPDSSDSSQPSLKQLLTQLQSSIEAEIELKPEDKAEALEQVKILAAAGQKNNDGPLQKAAKTAMKVLKGTVASLPTMTPLVEACAKLLPAIATLLVLK